MPIVLFNRAFHISLFIYYLFIYLFNYYLIIIDR